MKNRILLLFFLCLVFSFYLINSSRTIAQVSCPTGNEQVQGSSTMAGNINIVDGWKPRPVPTIIASSDEIDPGGSITLHVNSGGLANPPYTWSAGNGYTFDPVQTEGDLENTTMTSASGTCGTNYDIWTTVTVTDASGETDTMDVRNTAGTWVEKSDGVCALSGDGTLTSDGSGNPCWDFSNSCSHTYDYELVVGNRKQTQMTCLNAGGGHSCEVRDCTDRCGYCSSYTSCENCIDPNPDHGMPCTDWEGGGGSSCYSLGGLKYYEWECP